MSLSDIGEHLAGMTDERLKAAFSEAQSDLANAAAHQPNTEWHQSCFAATLIYAGEMNVRGIHPNALR